MVHPKSQAEADIAFSPADRKAAAGRAAQLDLNAARQAFSRNQRKADRALADALSTRSLLDLVEFDKYAEMAQLAAARADACERVVAKLMGVQE